MTTSKSAYPRENLSNVLYYQLKFANYDRCMCKMIELPLKLFIGIDSSEFIKIESKELLISCKRD